MARALRIELDDESQAALAGEMTPLAAAAERVLASLADGADDGHRRAGASDPAEPAEPAPAPAMSAADPIPVDVPAPAAGAAQTDPPPPPETGRVTIVNNYDQTAVKYVTTPARRADNRYTRSDGEMP